MALTHKIEPNFFVQEKLTHEEVFQYLPQGQVLKGNVRTLQLSPEKENEVKVFLERAFSTFKKDVLEMERLHAKMWDCIWEGDLRGYRRAWSNVRRRKRIGGYNCIEYDWTFWHWNEKVRSGKWRTDGGYPFSLRLIGELFSRREAQLTRLTLNEMNRVLKNDGYSFLKVTNAGNEDLNERLRKGGWDEFRVILPDPLESLYGRLFRDSFAVNWNPDTLPIDKKVFVKRVEGVKPGEVSKNFYWVDNIDVYNTTHCNYRCGHCMAADVMKEGRVHMDEDMLFGLLDYLEGIVSVHFAGQGEFFTHPKAFDILDYASKKVLEVRVNTNGSFIPTDKDGAKKVFERLPKNTHIFLSIDKYHERQDPHLKQRVELLKEFSKLYGFKVTFSLRVRDKYSDEKHGLIGKYQINGYPVIVNRVLKQGRGRRIPDTRYLILEKLLYNITNKPTVGVLPDGTVVTNFIVAYLPKDARPFCGTVGNIQEEGLPITIKRYEQLIETLKDYENAMLNLMNMEVGSHYPYVKNN